MSMKAGQSPETLLRERLRDPGVEDVDWLNARDPAKNLLIRFRQDGQERVLKIFRHPLRYALQVVKNPLARYWSRAFKLRSSIRARVRSELESCAAFEQHGLPAFRVLANPAPDALVYPLYRGEPLRRRLSRGDALQRRHALERFVDDFCRRQELAARLGDRRLVHPDPSPKHVWVTPEDELLQFDFEGRVNPSLTLDEALARETESCLFALSRLTDLEPGGLRALVARMDPAAVDRWRRLAHSPAWRRSKTNRRRTGAVAALLG